MIIAEDTVLSGSMLSLLIKEEVSFLHRNDILSYCLIYCTKSHALMFHLIQLFKIMQTDNRNILDFGHFHLVNTFASEMLIIYFNVILKINNVQYMHKYHMYSTAETRTIKSHTLYSAHTSAFFIGIRHDIMHFPDTGFTHESAISVEIGMNIIRMI